MRTFFEPRRVEMIHLAPASFLSNKTLSRHDHLQCQIKCLELSDDYRYWRSKLPLRSFEEWLNDTSSNHASDSKESTTPHKQWITQLITANVFPNSPVCSMADFWGCDRCVTYEATQFHSSTTRVMPAVQSSTWGYWEWVFSLIPTLAMALTYCCFIQSMIFTLTCLTTHFTAISFTTPAASYVSPHSTHIKITLRSAEFAKRAAQSSVNTRLFPQFSHVNLSSEEEDVPDVDAGETEVEEMSRPRPKGPQFGAQNSKRWWGSL